MARLFTLVVVLAAALALAGTGLAKGPSEARIEGPGLTAPLELTGFGEDGSGPLGALTIDGGFLATTFGQEPDVRLPGRPSGDLGPRYDVEYTVPAGESEPWRLEQELYPYAQGGPVLFTRPGQPIFEGTAPSVGGWVRAPASLLEVLVGAGLPAGPPDGGGLSESAQAASLAAVAATILGVAGLLTLRWRRRPRPPRVHGRV